MGRAATRLTQIAAPLRPKKAPYYVRHPLPASLERYFPADGWYWIPNGADVAEFLGRTAGLAEHRLREMIEREEATA